MRSWRTDSQNGSIPSTNKKRRINLKFFRDKQTDGQTVKHTDRVNDKKIIDS